MNNLLDRLENARRRFRTVYYKTDSLLDEAIYGTHAIEGLRYGMRLFMTGANGCMGDILCNGRIDRFNVEEYPVDAQNFIHWLDYVSDVMEADA